MNRLLQQSKVESFVYLFVLSKSFQDFKIVFLIVDCSKKIPKNMTFAEAWRRAQNSIKEANAELRRKTKRISNSGNSSIQ